MEHYHQLTEFLLRLIKVQIEKYTGLADFGVGPDAGINGFLVVDEVNELLVFADKLIGLIDANENHASVFAYILSQTQFYLDQEDLRGYAGWLLDENPIHSAEFKRLQRYKDDIKAITLKSGLTNLPHTNAVSEAQMQCEHDSNSIAFKITNLVVELKKNPDMELSDTVVPKHALAIIRKHAKSGGRYDNNDIYSEIERLQRECGEYLSQSKLETSTRPLTKEQASEIRHGHEQQFFDLLDHYQKLNPSSQLFTDNPGWYEIGGRHHITPPQAPAVTSQGLFSNKTTTMFAVGAAAILLLILNLAVSTDRNVTRFLP